MNCGAKVPPIPKKEKKRSNRNKRKKSKVVIPFLLVLILAILAFLIFGGDRVPENIRDIEGYSYLTGIVKDKIPDQMKDKLTDKIRLPSGIKDKFPLDFSFKLPFELPDPGSLLGGSKVPDEEKITKDLVAAGVDDKTVLADTSIYYDASSEWEHSGAKVIEHYTDEKSGLDIVVVYMELQNSYVKMAGTKEVTYQYNEQTKKWETVQISKLTAMSIEPVKVPATE